MAKKRFISVAKVQNTFYWDCPRKCGDFHEVDKSMVPLSITCECGYKYHAEKLTSIGMQSARLLISEEE